MKKKKNLPNLKKNSRKWMWRHLDFFFSFLYTNFFFEKDALNFFFLKTFFCINFKKKALQIKKKFKYGKKIVTSFKCIFYQKEYKRVIKEKLYTNIVFITFFFCACANFFVKVLWSHSLRMINYHSLQRFIFVCTQISAFHILENKLK